MIQIMITNMVEHTGRYLENFLQFFQIKMLLSFIISSWVWFIWHLTYFISLANQFHWKQIFVMLFFVFIDTLTWVIWAWKNRNINSKDFRDLWLSKLFVYWLVWGLFFMLDQVLSLQWVITLFITSFIVITELISILENLVKMWYWRYIPSWIIEKLKAKLEEINKFDKFDKK